MVGRGRLGEAGSVVSLEKKASYSRGMKLGCSKVLGAVQLLREYLCKVAGRRES